jgi:hypothetical protein
MAREALQAVLRQAPPQLAELATVMPMLERYTPVGQPKRTLHAS